MANAPYVGRFAPSPSGSLHAGSLLAAALSWVDARAHGGRWLLRFEDVDHERCKDEYKDIIRRQLSSFGLEWDAELPAQSTRRERYETILKSWARDGLAYGCACTRRELGAYRDSGETCYPGTCRDLRLPLEQNAVRFRLPEDSLVRFHDRRHGEAIQHVATQCGDIVLRRRTGDDTYQFAVCVDDMDQCITHVVRGDDLLASTGRQWLLMQALGAASPPLYLHHPVMLEPGGRKLSKSTGAGALPIAVPERSLLDALRALELVPDGHVKGRGERTFPHCSELLALAIQRWQSRLQSSSGKIEFSCIAASHG